MSNDPLIWVFISNSEYSEIFGEKVDAYLWNQCEFSCPHLYINYLSEIKIYIFKIKIYFEKMFHEPTKDMGDSVKYALQIIRVKKQIQIMKKIQNIIS